MKRWNVIVEASAQHDLTEAYLWLAERDEAVAHRWFDAISDTINTLQTFPERCPLAPESRFLDRDIREIFHGRRQHKYRILFTVTETAVHVLHVRHGARLALGDTGSF